MFDRLSIRRAMWAGASVIAVAALTTVVITNLELGVLRDKHHEQEAITTEIRAFDAVRENVIQIQQFLTDVSATGRPDGFADADRNATAAVHGLRSIADADPTVRDAALALVGEVSRFHAVGTAMAHEYLDHGREAGNRAMTSAGGFDEQADQINGKVAALARQLDARSADLSAGAALAERNARTVLTASLLVLIGLVAASLLLVWRRTMPSIVSLREAIDGLRNAKDAETRLPPMSGEFQEIAASFTALLDKLRAEQAERDVVNRFNERIRAALDNTSSAAIVLDAGGEIIYVNGAAERLFAQRIGDVRRMIADFAADRLVGVGISRFAALDRNATIFSGPVRTHQVADLRFGAAALRVTASPVVAASGEHLGAIVEWLDRTDEVEAEVELGQTIDAAAAGHLDQRVALEGKRGFFAVAARQMNALLDTNLRVFTDLQRVLGALAAGRLGERITADYRGMYAQIKADANATGEQLTATMAEIRSAAIQVRNDARELSRGTENLSARTEQQASSLQETASAMEEMTSTIKQNADNAVLANRLATQAAEVAERGTSVVTDAVAAMGEINASSRRIADIIGVVDEIALQTNLLALNAAVEAARAGEQGRGFAVVASEVRSLASRSAVAAKEIKALIQDSLDKVDGGSKLVDDSGQTLGEISTGMAKVRDLVAAISMASSEQARGVDEINRAVMQIDDTTQQNAALVEQTSAANQALTDQADRLSDLVSSFDLGDAPTLQVVPSRGPRVAGVA